MWASSNKAAQKAGNGTHIAIRIDNLRFGEGSDDKSRVDLIVVGRSPGRLLQDYTRLYILLPDVEGRLGRILVEEHPTISRQDQATI